MLNTAATKIYWKHDTKNSAEFSKLLASSLPSSAFGSVGTGAAYLAFTFSMCAVKSGARQTYQSCDRTQKNAQN